MAKNYKLAAEKMQTLEGEAPEERERRIRYEARLRIEVPEPPLLNIREAALNAVGKCDISIKTDRYPDGALFKATAYGVAQREGESRLRLTLRQSITGLGKVQGKTKLEPVRKAIASIVSDEVRSIVSNAFEARIAKGMEAETALAMPIKYPRFNKQIHKVRCFENYAEDAQPIIFANRKDASLQNDPKKMGAFRKYLVNEGYAYLELVSTGEQEPRLVKIRDAMRNKNKAASKVSTRFHKGDTVRDSKDKKLYRLGYFKAVGTICLIPIFDPRSFDKITEASSGKKSVAFTQAISRLSLIS